jgi:hypothetical protein
MRLPALSVLLSLSLSCIAATTPEKGGDFTGVWMATICPPGIKSDPGRCAHFVLELFQKEDRLCGSHVFATAGAAQMDEGGTPSITGQVAEGIAHVTVQSGRGSPPMRVPAELRVVNDRLQWKREETPPGDYLLPLSAQLSKSKSKTMFAPTFAQQLQAACR